MNWLVVGGVVAVFYLGAFGYCVAQRRWPRGGLAVGLVNLFLAFVHSVAPIRGWLDQDYVGYVFGFLRVPQGPGVTLIAGSIFVLATYSACVAVLDRRAQAMRVVALFDGLIGANLGLALLWSFFREPGLLKLQLGEYVTIGPLGAVLIEGGIMSAPLLLGALWALRRTGGGGVGNPVPGYSS